ncbi:hypothetical protein [Streptomyces sp. NPDC001076]
MAAELYAAGVPLLAISERLRELMLHVEHIAARFLEFTTDHVFARHLDDPDHRTDAGAAEAASLGQRLRPLAQQTVVAELARAIGLFATREVRRQLGAGEQPKAPEKKRPVSLTAGTIQAVRRLVGPERIAEFIAPAAERELRARHLDTLTAHHGPVNDLDEPPRNTQQLSTPRPISLWITSLGCGSNLRRKISA